MLKFTVPGQPVAKQRARTFWNDRAGKVTTWTPDKTVSGEAAIRLFAAQAGATPMEGPLSLKISLYLAIPHSWSRRRYSDALSGVTRPQTKPDWDNYGKLVSDALNGLAWRDDGQIVLATVEKWYSQDPRTEIEVANIV